MYKPLISVCIPTYNGSKYIEEALQSVNNQTYRPLEIIISDDSSTDNTLQIVNNFKVKTDIVIRCFLHRRKGIGSNLNNCVINSLGEFIKFVFQDDFMENNCIEKMLECAIKFKNIGLVFCKRKILLENNDIDINDFNEWYKQFGNLTDSWTNLKEFQTGVELLNDDKFLHSPYNKVGEPIAPLINKECFYKVGYFNTFLKQALDYEFYYRVFKHYNVGFINEELVTFRRHSTQATEKNRNNKFSYEYELLFISYFKNLFNCFSKKVKKDLLIRIIGMPINFIYKLTFAQVKYYFRRQF
ncbi:glycosyltransferase family 2 protein [Bacteroidetes/Chlorobi group bacterium ChocPot_Mid]|nr:MAG: glycosyltransferase family 2 protein [Bacteroidetes/Chlorobi group bacterium ChocPot_Mid]